jgi:hypothetical protein
MKVYVGYFDTKFARLKLPYLASCKEDKIVKLEDSPKELC